MLKTSGNNLIERMRDRKSASCSHNWIERSGISKKSCTTSGTLEIIVMTPHLYRACYLNQLHLAETNFKICFAHSVLSPTLTHSLSLSLVKFPFFTWISANIYRWIFCRCIRECLCVPTNSMISNSIKGQNGTPHLLVCNRSHFHRKIHCVTSGLYWTRQNEGKLRRLRQTRRFNQLKPLFLLNFFLHCVNS